MAKEHTIRQYDTELIDIRGKILTMGDKVESMITSAIKALVDRDTGLAERVMPAEQEVNRLELAIDERCLQMIARWQPTAGDLRILTYMMEDPTTITRAMKLTYIAKYLERIADHATNVAEMVIFMVKGKDIRHTTIS